jgi:hypothetical protein
LIFSQYQNCEAQKDDLESEYQVKNNLLICELEKLMDHKREMEFELQMLKDQNGRIA